MESSPRELATHQLKVRFFDLDATIRSDSSDFVSLFGRMYRRFEIDALPSSVQAPVEFAVLTKSDNQWGKPIMILGEEVWPLTDPGLVEGHAYESILNSIVARVRSYFLIHAGVVSHGDQGIILAADSTHGKTTLVLELVRRGFRFLSDEMAALGRSDRRVHPFPRSLRIRPGTLELAGFPPADAETPQWLGKLILDIEEIRPGSMGQEAEISHIIVLRDPSDEEEQPNIPERELGILVDRLTEPFLKAVRQIEGVGKVHTDTDYGYPLLRLRAVRRMPVLSQIEALCQEEGILILDVIKRVEGHPSFETPARLETTPKSQAVMELLRRFQGGHKSALLQDEFDGSSTRLFMELATVIGRANCCQLFVGPLTEMADLVCGLVGVS